MSAISRFMMIFIIMMSLSSVSLCNFLLQRPPEITPDFFEHLKNFSMAMNFETFDDTTGSCIQLLFDHVDGKTTAGILVDGRSIENYQELEYYINHSNWFMRNIRKVGNTIFRYVLNLFSGLVHEPLIIRESNPRQLSVDDVAFLVENAHVVVYTGAGISAGAVPTLPDILKNIGLEFEGDQNKQEAFRAVIRHMLDSPETSLEYMDLFYNSCLYAEPTHAHIAVKDMIVTKNWGLLTENLDLLHQRTGVMPLHPRYGFGRHWIKSQVSVHDLKKINYVLTVGLAHDENGFLGWYKAYNPGGIIIAINLHRPDYLSDNDIFIQGNAQKVVPDLYTQIIGGPVLGERH